MPINFLTEKFILKNEFEDLQRGADAKNTIDKSLEKNYLKIKRIKNAFNESTHSTNALNWERRNNFL